MFRSVFQVLAALFGTLALFPASASAQWSQPPTMEPGAPGSCPAVKPRGDIVILSMYGGSGQRPAYTLEGAEHPLNIVKVSGDKGKREKVTLVLAAYEPTVWDLSEVKGRIAGVMSYGFYPQAISGLPKSVPIVFQTVNGPEDIKVSSNSVCYAGYEHEDMYKIQRQAKTIQSILGGQHPRRWYGGYQPSAFSIDGGSVSAPTMVKAEGLRTNVPLKTAGLMPGNDGLEQLVQAGYLRRFSKKDVNAWSARGAEIEMIGGPMMGMQTSHDPIQYIGSASSGYLVLKNMSEAPAGLNGANSVVFMVPEGVAMPDRVGHSAIYRLSNYPGRIPPPGELVPVDTRAQHILQSDMRYTVANKFVEWDEDGKVTKDGTAEVNRPIQVSVNQPTLPPLDAGNSAAEETKDEDSGSYALPVIILLLLASAAGALFWYKRKRNRPEEDVHPEELQVLLNDLDRVIEACEEDATSLSVSRFKRLLIKAVNEADFDDDLAAQLDEIASEHIPNYTRSYLSAIKLGRDDDIEAKMRRTIDVMSERISEIIATQRARYRDSFDINDGYVRNVHDKSTPFD